MILRKFLKQGCDIITNTALIFFNINKLLKKKTKYPSMKLKVSLKTGYVLIATYFCLINFYHVLKKVGSLDAYQIVLLLRI